MRNLLQNLPMGTEKMPFSHRRYTLQYLSFGMVCFQPLAVCEAADVMRTKTPEHSSRSVGFRACSQASVVGFNALAFDCFSEEIS